MTGAQRRAARAAVRARRDAKKGKKKGGTSFSAGVVTTAPALIRSGAKYGDGGISKLYISSDKKVIGVASCGSDATVCKTQDDVKALATWLASLIGMELAAKDKGINVFSAKVSLENTDE